MLVFRAKSPSPCTHAMQEAIGRVQGAARLLEVEGRGSPVALSDSSPFPPHAVSDSAVSRDRAEAAADVVRFK